MDPIYQNTALLCLMGQVWELRAWLRNLMRVMHRQTWPLSDDMSWRMTFLTLYGASARDQGGEIQLADAINIHTQRGSVETVRLNGRRFDCGSVDEFLDAIMFAHNKMTQ
jgi:hypothetical protein